MARWRSAILATILVAAGASTNAAPCTLAALHWMKGVWRNGDGQTRSEERWTIGPGDRLMGSSWLLHPDRAGGVIEASTIQDEGTGVAMKLRHFSATLGQAREEKNAPMVFAAARCDANAVVFDGQGPQAGEHMTYRRSGDTLDFVGDFLHQGTPIKVEVRFQRADD